MSFSLAMGLWEARKVSRPCQQLVTAPVVLLGRHGAGLEAPALTWPSAAPQLRAAGPTKPSKAGKSSPIWGL